MAVTVAAFGTDLTQATSATAAVPVPAGVANNSIILVQISTPSTTATVNTVASGFAEVASSPIYSSVTAPHRSQIFWKRATAADTGTYAFGMSASVARRGKAVRLEGCVTTGNPIDVETGYLSSTFGTDLGPVAVTTTVTDTLLFFLASVSDTNRTVIDSPAGFTEDLEQLSAGRLFASMPKAATGATGSLLGTMTGAGYGRTVWLAALKPSLAAPSQFFAMF